MSYFNNDSRIFFLNAIRVLFGIWFLYVGLFKWIAIGPEPFVGLITTDFDKTWSPHLLNVFLAWVILIAEPGLALLILIGKKRRLVWALTSLFLFMLTMGQTILMKPEVTANWQYVILTVICAALSVPNEDVQPAQA
jgi:uncharacterized membrane protein YphA (DoxX/SURF4 family)